MVTMRQMVETRPLCLYVCTTNSAMLPCTICTPTPSRAYVLSLRTGRAHSQERERGTWRPSPMPMKAPIKSR